MNQSNNETFQALDRKVRLKKLMDDAKDIGDNLQEHTPIETMQAVNELIATSDDINAEASVQERAQNSTEVVMDAHLLKMSLEIVSKVLQNNTEFNEFKYQTAIKRIVFTGDEAKWNDITEIACAIARTARVQSSMLGAIEIEHQERVVKQRQQRVRAKPTAEKRPEEVDKLTRQDRGGEKVNVVYKQLQEIFSANGRQPVPFYKLIIDPFNFMTTVENAFQLSFLARDSIIAIESGEDLYPHVRLVTPEERKMEKETSQSICTLNMKLCQEMILFYDIKEPMLKLTTTKTEDSTSSTSQ